MSLYRVKEPSLQKLDELSALSFNMIYWRIEFRKSLGEEAKRNEDISERELEKWLRENVEEKPKLG